MKKYFRDYCELCKETGKFYKRHWIGVVIMNIVGIAAVLAWFFRGAIIEEIKCKFKKIKMGKKEAR